MKKLFLVVTVSLVSGCVTGSAAQCKALRSQLDGSTMFCNECLGQLSIHGERDACSSACEQPGKVAPLALNHCATAAEEFLAAKAKADKK